MRDWGLSIRMIIASTILAAVYGLIALALFAAGGILATVIGLPLLIYAQYLVKVQLPLWKDEAAEIPRESYPELYRRAENLAKEMDIEMPELYFMDADEINAFALGRQGNGKVFFTRKAFESLSTDEIEPVIAHEFAHLKNRDSILMSLGTSIAQIISSITLIAFFIASLDSDRPWLVRIAGVVVSTAIHFFILLFVRIMSRYREYVADEDAVRYTGQYDGMANALSKIEHEQSNQKESDLSTAQQAVSFFSTTNGILTTIFSTHPSPQKRIDRIQQLKSDADNTPEKSVLRDVPDFEGSRFSSDSDLLGELRSMDEYEFEHLVADIWDSLDWNARVTSESADQGIDVIATTQEPFPQKQLIQAKRYGEETTVGSTEIQQYASLQLQEDNVDAVAVVTTGEFSAQAEELADDLNVKLVDGQDLCYLIGEQELFNRVEARL